LAGSFPPISGARRFDSAQDRQPFVTDPAHPAFVSLAGARRVWAIGAARGEIARVESVHQEIAARFLPGDRIVYLGGVLGVGADPAATVDAILRFRLRTLARLDLCVAGFVVLRGSLEEMWRRFLELQFAMNPAEILEWMLAHGIGATLQSYGGSIETARRVCREGPLAITRYTNEIRNAVHRRPGHDQFAAAIRRAAYTERGELLFSAAGVDPKRPLSEQGDTLWWGSGYFTSISAPYAGFRRVVRGDDRHRNSLEMGEFTATLDGGCGFGGTLNAACFSLDGRPVDWVQV
jgi:serine/threonine protein phosphatase 1